MNVTFAIAHLEHSTILTCKTAFPELARLCTVFRESCKNVIYMVWLTSLIAKSCVFSSQYLRQCDYGVSVHIIEPGLFQTAFSRREAIAKQLQGTWDRLSEREKKVFGDNYYHTCKNQLADDRFIFTYDFWRSEKSLSSKIVFNWY